MEVKQAVVSVENLGKRYALGGLESLHKTFREMLIEVFYAPVRRYKKLSGSVDKKELFWALKDINFTINKGEIVGIIGKNGAGKSTLLKILSRITTPTEGKVTIQGKVASLLEVGTGFHPELSGRENIFLNGAILGMSRHEIRQKFDDIVDFADIRQFVDTPVKRYSSGMYVRLAFSIAAHIDPDVLIVDEVLAVGDVQFQKRCLGKIKDVAGEGRTVLFVSHNMASVESLCTQAIFLDNGKIIMKDETSVVVNQYLKSVGIDSESENGIHTKQLQEHQAKPELPLVLDYLKITNNEDIDSVYFNINSTINIKLFYEAKTHIDSCTFGVVIKNALGLVVFKLNTWPISGAKVADLIGKGSVVLTLDKVNLTGGEYFITLYCTRPGLGVIWTLENLAKINIRPSDVYKNGYALKNAYDGVITLDHSWHIN